MKNLYLILKITCIWLFALYFLSPAYAATSSACYSSDEAEAEEGIRLQNELMLIGLACNKTAEYRQFYQSHAELWDDYEQTLSHFLKKTKGAPSLDGLKTRLGNESASRLGQITKPVFCRLQANSFKELQGKTTEQLRVKLRLVNEKHKLTYPKCAE